MAGRQTATKSRIEKGGRGGTSAPTPTVAHDIIPGKFTNLDWNYTLNLEETDSFINKIVHEIKDKALHQIYDEYIERQLIPFTVNLAKDAIVQIVEWRFLSFDKGEPDILIDATWSEDIEPESCVVDSWAQGAIPKRPIDFSSPCNSSRGTKEANSRLLTITEEQHLQKREEIVECWTAPEEANPSVADETNACSVEPDNAPDANNAEHGSSGTLTPCNLVFEEIPDEGNPIPIAKKEAFIPGWSKRPRPIKFKPYGGRMKSAGLSQLTESLEETERRLEMEERMKINQRKMEQEREHAAAAARAALRGSVIPESLLEVQMSSSISTLNKAGQSPAPQAGSGSVSLQQQMELNSIRYASQIIKVNPEQLPQQRVKFNYRVVDPEVEAANARLEAMKRGKRFAEGGSHPKGMASNGRKGSMSNALTASSTLGGRYGDIPVITGAPDPSGKVLRKEEALVDPLPSSMIDCIALAPGVIAKESGRVKRGPKYNAGNNLLPDPNVRALKPVRPKMESNHMNEINHVVNESNIVMKPMRDVKPIPPIPCERAS